MLGNYAVVEKMKSEFGDQVACISIGRAGEMKPASSTIAFTVLDQPETFQAFIDMLNACYGLNFSADDDLDRMINW